MARHPAYEAEIEGIWQGIRESQTPLHVADLGRDFRAGDLYMMNSYLEAAPSPSPESSPSSAAVAASSRRRCLPAIPCIPRTTSQKRHQQPVNYLTVRIANPDKIGTLRKQSAKNH